MRVAYSRNTSCEDATYHCFKEVAIQITRRIDLMLALPLENLKNNCTDFENKIKAIGHQD